PRGVEATDLDSCGAEPTPEGTPGLAERAHPVVQQAHADTVPRAAHECFRELLTGVVVVDYVALEVNPPLGVLDRVQPGGVVLGGVAEKAHRIAGNERGAGGTSERTVGERQVAVPESVERVRRIRTCDRCCHGMCEVA